MILDLIADFLEFFQLQYSLSVFNSESSLQPQQQSERARKL